MNKLNVILTSDQELIEGLDPMVDRANAVAADAVNERLLEIGLSYEAVRKRITMVPELPKPTQDLCESTYTYYLDFGTAKQVLLVRETVSVTRNGDDVSIKQQFCC